MPTKIYRDSSRDTYVRVIERLNHCGVKVEDEHGNVYVTCFCSLLA